MTRPGSHPVVRRFGFAPIARATGFVFSQQTRPRAPTESSSPCPGVSGPCYGLVVLVPLLSTPPRGDAVTVRYPTTLRRRETDLHRSVCAPSQAHWQFSRCENPARAERAEQRPGNLRLGHAFAPLNAALLLAARGVPVRLRGREDRTVEVRFPAAKSRGVSNRNCVAARRGGEQRNENDQSVTTSRHTGTR